MLNIYKYDKIWDVKNYPSHYKTGNPSAPPETRIILLFTAVIINSNVCAELCPEAALPVPLAPTVAAAEASGTILTLVSLP